MPIRIPALTISARIWIGFSILLALLVAIGSESIWSFKRAERGFVNYNELTRDADLAANVKFHMLRTILGVNNFLLSDNPEDAAAVFETQQMMADLLDKTELDIADQEHAEQVHEMRRNLTSYIDSFQIITETRDQKIEIISNLNELGPIIREQLTQVIEDMHSRNMNDISFKAMKAQEAFLLTRTYIARYLMLARKHDAQRAITEIWKTTEYLKHLYFNLNKTPAKKQAKEIQNNFANYVKNFRELAKIIKEREVVVSDKLAVIGPAVFSAAQIIDERVSNDQEALGPAMIVNAQSAVLFNTGLTIAAFIIGTLAAWLIAKSVTVPLTQMTECMGALARGELDIRIEKGNRRDEIGLAFKALAIFKENALERHALAEREKTRVQNMEKTIAKFDQQASRSLLDVDSACRQLDQVSAIMTAATDSSNKSVSDVAAASEQLSLSIAEISNSTIKSREVTACSVDEATQASEKVERFVNDLQEVRKVVDLISDIADQTHLLSLNASIEAARAGTKGNGFAIVASEVKRLAGRTAEATKEVDQGIKKIAGSAGSAATSMKQVQQTINRVDEFSLFIAGAIEEQRQSTSEIVASANQASQSAKEVGLRISGSQIRNDDDNESIRGAGRKLTDITRNLRGDVDHFLESIKSI